MKSVLWAILSVFSYTKCSNLCPTKAYLNGKALRNEYAKLRKEASTMSTVTYLRFRFDLEFQIAVRWDALKRFFGLVYGVAESVLS